MEADELDRQVLVLLAKNGRLPSSEIARTGDASERTVANRVNSLIEFSNLWRKNWQKFPALSA